MKLKQIIFCEFERGNIEVTQKEFECYRDEADQLYLPMHQNIYYLCPLRKKCRWKRRYRLIEIEE